MQRYTIFNNSMEQWHGITMTSSALTTSFTLVKTRLYPVSIWRQNIWTIRYNGLFLCYLCSHTWGHQTFQVCSLLFYLNPNCDDDLKISFTIWVITICNINMTCRFLQSVISYIFNFFFYYFRLFLLGVATANQLSHVTPVERVWRGRLIVSPGLSFWPLGLT